MEYVKDYHAGHAARRAGYSEKNASAQGSKLLKNSDVLERIHELQERQVKQLAISADWVVLQLVEVYKRCMQAVPVQVWDAKSHAYVDSDSEFTFDAKGALNALEQIGKHLGMFNGKTAEGKKQSDALRQLTEALGCVE